MRVRAFTSACGHLFAVLAALQATPVAAATLQSPSGGQVHALVIGIDDYVTQRPLKGAVADATDIATALRRARVSNLMILIDRQATRQAILAAIDRLAADAKAGDLVFISFAGHGAQLPEITPGSNANGMDEIFVLPNFDTRGPATAERILDKEINALLARFERRGVYSLFVADTCHGGGLTRSVDARADNISYRQANILRVDADELKPINTPAEAMLDESSFERLTFLGAVDKNTKAPEVPIPGTSTLRGALSYAVARAIEGSAPKLLDGGSISRKRLFEYARQVTSQYSESRQVITVEPLRSAALLDAPVFKLIDPPQPAPTMAMLGKDAPIVIRIDGAPRRLDLVTPVVTPFRVAAAGETADLIWDGRSGDVVSAGGSIIALGASDRDLPGIVDRTRAVATLAKLAESRPQTIELKPDNGLHRDGAKVSFEADNVQGQSLIVLDITGDGTVQILFPKAGDAAVFPAGTWRLPLTVSAPFGGDTVIALAAPQPSPALLDALNKLEGKKNPARVADLIEQEVRRAPATKIGLVGLFTAP